MIFDMFCGSRRREKRKGKELERKDEDDDCDYENGLSKRKCRSLTWTREDTRKERSHMRQGKRLRL